MTDFKPNYRGGSEILTSEAMLTMLMEKAERVKTVAEGLADEIDGPENPTHYRNSFGVEGTTHGGGLGGRWPGPRAQASVVNYDAQATAVEFGVPAYPNYPKRRILGRALDTLK